ncbi:MAG: plastocyanin/azurin family copper-binding protein [Candidatus Fermentibacteraceae bacterium]
MFSGRGRKAFTLVCGAALLLGLSAVAYASGHNPSGEEMEEVDDNIISIEEGAFVPETLRVIEGATVTWINRDSFGHEITDGLPGDENGEFTSDRIFRGERFSHTFEETGVYPYFCRLYTTMTGVVMVETAEEMVEEY